MSSDIRANIWKLGIFKFLSDFWIIVPTIVPFYKANGLSATQILVIQSVFSAVVLLVEIPSGYLSDAAGRKKTLFIGALLFPIGLSIYAFSGSFWMFMFAEIFLAAAVSMRSGTDSAMLYDTLQECGIENRYRKIEGINTSLERAGTAISALLGGLLAGIALRLPFYVNIGTALLLIFSVLWLKEPARKFRSSEQPLRDVLGIVRYALSHKQIMGIMLFSSLIFCSGIVSIWGYFLIMNKAGIGLIYYGVFFAGFQLVCALGAATASKYESLIGRKNAIYSLLLIPLGYLSFSFCDSHYLWIFAGINAYLWGVSYPVFLDNLNDLIESDRRATVISTGSMIGRTSLVVVAPLFGFLTDKVSINCAFMFLSIYFIVVSVFTLRLLRKNGEEGKINE